MQLDISSLYTIHHQIRMPQSRRPMLGPRRLTLKWNE